MENQAKVAGPRKEPTRKPNPLNHFPPMKKKIKVVKKVRTLNEKGIQGGPMFPLLDLTWPTAAPTEVDDLLGGGDGFERFIYI